MLSGKKVISEIGSDNIDLYKIKEGVNNWIESVRDQNSVLYNFSKETKFPTLLSNCFMVLALELWDEIDSFLGDKKEILSSYILNCQKNKAGLFIDPLLKKEDLLLPEVHSWDYVTMQSTMFSVSVLDALGEKPRYEFKFLDKYKDTDYLIRWLQDRNWRNPWLESNNIMFVSCLLLYEYIQTKDSQILELIHEFLNWFDKYQDPKTGFWGTDKGASLANAMAGAFHVYLIYHYLKRPIQYKEKIIDSVLSLQQKDGLFATDGGGGSCEDLDAIDILVKLATLTDYRKGDIKQALLKSLEALVNGQNKDGGFSWKIEAKKGFIRRLRYFTKTSFYSDWRLMPFNTYRSDMWSSWFRPLAIALIVSTYPEEFGSDFEFKFRRLPGLGWHF